MSNVLIDLRGRHVCRKKTRGVLLHKFFYIYKHARATHAPRTLFFIASMAEGTSRSGSSCEDFVVPSDDYGPRDVARWAMIRVLNRSGDAPMKLLRQYVLQHNFLSKDTSKEGLYTKIKAERAIKAKEQVKNREKFAKQVKKAKEATEKAKKQEKTIAFLILAHRP